MTLALSASLMAACGGGGEEFVGVGQGRGDAGSRTDAADMPYPFHGCDRVQVDGQGVVEQEKDFTARFQMGEPYTKTVMLFGGVPVEDDNVFSNANIFGLDKQDALMLAKKYPDFSNCRSPGGEEASKFIISYDLVPANCEVFEEIVAALRQYDINVSRGGDRTSLRFDGAPLELVSVTDEVSGEDATSRVTGQNFHLVTAVEQLTGESVLSFGTNE